MNDAEKTPKLTGLKGFAIIGGGIFALMLLLGAIGGRNPQRPLTDREHVEAGAAKIDNYCSSVDSC